VVKVPTLCLFVDDVVGTGVYGGSSASLNGCRKDPYGPKSSKSRAPGANVQSALD